MTAPAKSSQWISPDEYLEGERFSDVRHEYIDGAVYPMAGASDDHNRIALNIAAELKAQLRGRRCEAFMNDMKVKASSNSSLFYYPDVFVVCDPKDNARYFRERPTVIFEVISPETERTDRREKFLSYRAIVSVQTYILVEQDRLAAMVYRRSGTQWTSESLEGDAAVLSLPEIQAKLPFSVIYERTTVAASAKTAHGKSVAQQNS